MFVALQKINHTKLIDEFGTGRFFSEEERKTIIGLLLSSKELKYGTIRKKLNIDIEALDNSKEGNVSFISNRSEIKEILDEISFALDLLSGEINNLSKL